MEGFAFHPEVLNPELILSFLAKKRRQ